MFAKCVQTFISNVYRDSNSLIVNQIIILDVQRKLSTDDWTRKSNLFVGLLFNQKSSNSLERKFHEFREWNIKENNLALFHETLSIEYILY